MIVLLLNLLLELINSPKTFYYLGLILKSRGSFAGLIIFAFYNNVA
jgi:hypothetical protein